MISSKLRLIIEGACMVLAGVICLGASAHAFFQSQHFLRTAVHVNAWVMRLNEGYDGSNYSRTVYYPAFVFEDAKWHRVEAYPHIMVPANSLKRGDQAPLIYAPDHPWDAKPYAFRDFWMRPVIYCGVGVVFLGLGLGALCRAKSE